MFDPYPMMFHPTLIVDDLEGAAAWFRRVFGRREVRWEEKFDLRLLNPEYPTNYSYFFVIGDVSLDVLAPSLLTLPGNTAAVYNAKNGLSDIAWYTNDIAALARKLEQSGFNTRDQTGNQIADGNVPPSPLVHDNPMIWTYPEETGLTYEFYTMGRRHWPLYSKRADPRLDPSWQPRVVDRDDPLGVITSSYHTIRTFDQARARRLYVGALGGDIIDEGRCRHTGSDVTLISYAKSVLRFTTPLGAQPVDRDQYLGMTFLVEDLVRVESKLVSENVSVRRHPLGITTHASETFGVLWGFTDQELSTLGVHGPGE